MPLAKYHDARNLISLTSTRSPAMKSPRIISAGPIKPWRAAAGLEQMSGSGLKNRKYSGLRCMSVLASGADLVRLHTRLRFVPTPKIAEQRKSRPKAALILNSNDRASGHNAGFQSRRQAMKPRPSTRPSKWAMMKWAAMSFGFAGNTAAAPRGDAGLFRHLFSQPPFAVGGIRTSSSIVPW
jgi:hypothetical protein